MVERELRRAGYALELRWGLDAGLNPAQDFRGLSDQLGSNPDLGALREALRGRVALLPRDPWAEETESSPLLLAA